MNYSPLQLEAIRIFGKKDLTEGCVILEEEMQRHFMIAGVGEVKMYGNPIWVMDGGIPKGPYKWNFEILGHEPHLEDVFRVAYEKGYGYNISDWHYPVFYNIEKQINFPDIKGYNQTIRLLEQSEETLTQLINLFK